MDHIEADLPVDFFGKAQFLLECCTIFTKISDGAVPLRGQPVAEDMHALQCFFLFGIALSYRADHRNGIVVCSQCRSLLPDAGVKGDGQILNNDQDLSLLFHCLLSVFHAVCTSKIRIHFSRQI